MNNFLRRMAGTGMNVGVIAISIAVFLISLFVMMGIANAGKPETMDILAASKDLSVGQYLTPNDFVVKTVFVDSNRELYIPATTEGIASVMGGVIVSPVYVSQPIFRTSIVAKASGDTRLSAVLANYPEGGSLFPLPLSFSNVVAADIDTYRPGDLINITLVISSRPPPPVTPTFIPEYVLREGFPYVDTIPQNVATPIPVISELDKEKSLLYPPVAKDLFSFGVRIISIQGATQYVDPAASTQKTVDPAAGYIAFDTPPVLILLIPNDKREELAFALKEGDMLVVSLIDRGDNEPTTGFSYWDYEEWLKAEREASIKKIENPTEVAPTSTPTAIPATPTPPTP